MKTIKHIVFASCVALAGLCFAQEPDDDLYAVIDLSGGSAALEYPVSYTNAPFYGDQWTNGTDVSYLTTKLVLKKIADPAGTNTYYISPFKITKGQMNQINSSLGVYQDPSTLMLLTYGNLSSFLSALEKTGLQNFKASQNPDAHVPVPGNSNPNAIVPGDGAYLYMKTAFLLTVEGGTGSVYTKAGERVAIAATNDTHTTEFIKWNIAPLYYEDGSSFDLGDFETNSPNATVTVPWCDLTLTAEVFPNPYLTVINGAGDVITTNSVPYRRGTVVTVEVAEVSHYSFEKWQVDPPTATNDFGGHFSETNLTTAVVVSYDVQLTALYTNTLYTLTVIDGTASRTGVYTNNEVVNIVAHTPADPHMEFDRWTSDGGTITVDDATNSTTTVTIPGRDITLTATYRDKRYPLTVVDGSGTGNYTNNQVVTITANSNFPTTGHIFDHWEADGATVADPTSASTTVSIPGSAVTVTAIYTAKEVKQDTFMVLDLTGGAVEYLDVAPASWDTVYKSDKMVLRKVNAGSFTMGSPTGEADYADRWSETQHAVTLTEDFYLGIFEVTQAQWENIQGNTPSYFSGGTLPVELVSYEDIRGPHAQANWPSIAAPAAGSFMAQLRSIAPGADLPTEAQWEYACRAGTTGAYANGSPSLNVWYSDTSGGTTHPVGTKIPNDWGFYDMHGNVEEMCLDWWSNDLGSAAQIDPTGPTNSTVASTFESPRRVRRGGAYDSSAGQVRSAYRANIPVTNYYDNATPPVFQTNAYRMVGFRVAISQTTASHQLTVVNGTVNTGGVFAAGTAIGLESAPAPDGKQFGAWQVSPAGLDLGTGFDATVAQTLLTMPESSLTLTAVYMSTNATGIYRFQQNNPAGATEQWREDGETFAVAAPAPAAGYRFESWTVSPANADLGLDFSVGSATGSIVMPAHDVTLTPNYVLDIPDISSAAPIIGVAVSMDAGAGQRPATFSAKGLPSGLRIDRTTGVISGIPTKAGTYTIQITAKHAGGSTVTYSATITVSALPATAQGTFTGYIYAQDGGGQAQLRGLLTLKVTNRGKLSAKVTTQTATYSFSGKSWDPDSSIASGLFRATLARRQGETLTLTLNAATGELIAPSTITGGKITAGTLMLYAQRNNFLIRTDSAAQAELARYLGYYTVALPLDPANLTALGSLNNAQSGAGYLTVTVRARGAVKIAGKLADGTRVSASTTLLTDDAGAYIPLFVKLYARRGLFAGVLQISGSAKPSLRVIQWDQALMEWLYPGRNTRQTEDGFYALPSVYGAYYDTLINLQSFYLGTVIRAEGFGWSPPLVAGSSGSVTVAAGADNPDSLKLKTVKRTGLFSGSFKTLNSATGRTMTVKHAGVLTRENDAYVGEGAYVIQRKISGYTLKESYNVRID